MAENRDFGRRLLQWLDTEGQRDLPWKETSDPYLIWLSEVMLQQTRVEQGTPYFLAFRERYPTVHDLAAAPDDDVMKLWEGLGYYSRCRNMLHTARYISGELGGKFPANLEGLQQLKGVGKYTAAAIASFAFGLPHAVVDGNVYRVLTRHAGIFEPTNLPATQKIIAELAQNYLTTDRPADFNQAIMNLGAMVCTPVAPKCGTCPLQADCYARAHEAQADLPQKQKKAPKRQRFFHYFFARCGEDVLIRLRDGSDIWRGLYEFPMFEADSLLTFEELQPEVALVREASLRWMSPTFRQQLTHQTIVAVFYQVDVPALPDLGDCLAIPEKTLKNYAFPKIIREFLT